MAIFNGNGQRVTEIQAIRCSIKRQILIGDWLPIKQSDSQKYDLFARKIRLFLSLLRILKTCIQNFSEGFTDYWGCLYFILILWIPNK